MVGYADNQVVVMTDCSTEKFKTFIKEALETIGMCITKSELQLAPQKIEALIFSRRRNYDPSKHMDRRGIVSIGTGRYIKYLGVTLDSAIMFRRHLEDPSGRAVRIVTAVGRIMPNIGEPSTAIRALLQVVSSSRLMYATPVWAVGPVRGVAELEVVWNKDIFREL